jgi:hypothetical protein
MWASRPQAGQRHLVRDDPVVSALISCARDTLKQQDFDQMGQAAGLLPPEQLANLRHPEAPPGWLVPTTHREGPKILQATRSCDFPDPATDSCRRC